MPGGFSSSQSGATVPLARWTSTQGFTRATKNNATNSYRVCGYDSVSSTLFIADGTAAILRISEDGGATFSTTKGLPANVAAANIKKILRFGANWYLFGLNTSTSKFGVYRATPVTGNGALTWSAALVEQHASITTQQGTDFNADASYMYLGDYGDPTGGPSIQRSPDGDTWTTVYARDATLRHCHSVTPDPYNPGHVYACFGDNIVKPVQRSTDYGDNWTVLTAEQSWQAVQVSFDANYVYFASDWTSRTYNVLDRATGTFMIASPNFHYNIPVGILQNQKTWDPASVADGAQVNTTITVTGATIGEPVTVGFSVAVPAGLALTGSVTAADTATVTLTNHSGGAVDLASGTLYVMVGAGGQYFKNCFFGAVDPATGVYYANANDSSVPGIYMGMFYAPKVGTRLELFDRGGIGIAQSAEVFIAGSKVYCGQWQSARLIPA